MNTEDKTELEADTWFEELLSSGNWFRIYRPLTWIMKKNEAMFIEDLYNRKQMTRQKMNLWKRRGKFKRIPPIDAEGYFRCTIKYLQNPAYIEWSPMEQKTLFRSLRQAGILSVKRQGPDGRRWVKINTRKIRDMVLREREIRGLEL